MPDVPFNKLNLATSNVYDKHETDNAANLGSVVGTPNDTLQLLCKCHVRHKGCDNQVLQELNI